MSITEFQDYDLHTKDWGFVPNRRMQLCRFPGHAVRAQARSLLELVPEEPLETTYAGRAGQGGQVVLLQSILRCDGLPVPMLRTAQYSTTPTNRITRLAEHLR